MPSIDNIGNTINNIPLTDQSGTPTTPSAGKTRVFTKSDGLYIVNAAGTVTGPLAIASSGAATDGWVYDNRTWTYVSGSTFTIPGDVREYYRKGAKLRFKQGGTYKYATIASSSYSSPNTTVTIIVNIDYVVANSAITDNYYSYAECPVGFPAYFTWSPTPSNFTVGSGTLVARYLVNSLYSMLIYVKFTMGSGSSMGSGPTFSLPISTAERSIFSCYIEDAGIAGYMGACSVYNGTTCSINLIGTAGTYAGFSQITSSTPFTWGTGDFFEFSTTIVW